MNKPEEMLEGSREAGSLEILIGKYLDGEITAAEQRMLEAELDNNFQARELLEQLEDLHRRTRQAISSEILDRGKDAEEIFERAWQQQGKHPLRRIVRLSGHLRFATGLAAGLIIGLGLHFALSAHSVPKENELPPNPIVQDVAGQVDSQAPELQLLVPGEAENVIRSVDWYSFTDEAGDKWLIEGLREDVVRPAVYHDGL